MMVDMQGGRWVDLVLQIHDNSQFLLQLALSIHAHARHNGLFMYTKRDGKGCDRGAVGRETTSVCMME